MTIKTTNLTYNFDDTGKTVSATISFSGSDGANFLNANVSVGYEDTKDKTLDDLMKNELVAIAKQKLSTLVQLKD